MALPRFSWALIESAAFADGLSGWVHAGGMREVELELLLPQLGAVEVEEVRDVAGVVRGKHSRGWLAGCELTM